MPPRLHDYACFSSLFDACHAIASLEDLKIAPISIDVIAAIITMPFTASPFTPLLILFRHATV